jgi:hypothetical protein
MHLPEATHEHGSNARVYAYDADYEHDGQTVNWNATVRVGEAAPRRLSGSIPMTAASAEVVAEQAVRDAVVRRIDELDIATP